MNETKPDLNTIALLAEIHRLGGYGRAAERLGLSLATASRRIAALERAVGVKLLERNARYVRLTGSGERLLQQAEAPLGEIERAIEGVQESRKTVAGMVRIATTATLAETLLVPALATLRQSHPALRFEILLDEEVVDIRKHRIDFAIRAGDVRDYSAVARRIATHRISCWTTPDCLHQTELALLSYHPTQFGDASSAMVTVQDMGIIKQLVLAGLGEAWLPDTCCMAEEASGALIRRTDREEFFFEIFVVYPSRRYLTARARVVIEQLLAGKEVEI